jgi:hypothetical protein
MKRFVVLFLALALAWPALAADPPATQTVQVVARLDAADEPAKKVDPAPVVILPDAPPAPPVPPAPKTPAKLGADQIYLIRATAPCTVIEGVEGLVKIEAMTGPVVIRSRFTDSNGIETRTINEKYIWVVTATGTGRTDLIVIPEGGKALRRCLDVDAGPPGPGPIPPDPPGPVSPLTKAFLAAYALDTDADRAASLKYLQLVYAGMAQQAKSQTGLKTNADALAWIHGIVAAPNVGLTATQLVNLRKAIAAEMQATFGTTGTTPIDLAKLAAELDAISKALAGVR